ncbi:hypothetical protein RRG08_036944 [Elysia crispata]|uniref:Uncharacterized protein n=1 Tax=Elysia crispata TaxID=231223 RepID=A0AAE1D6I9_9GAST|nr:hypothetical protein RRG08_036944 [Elysia crispata]
MNRIDFNLDRPIRLVDWLLAGLTSQGWTQEDNITTMSTGPSAPPRQSVISDQLKTRQTNLQDHRTCPDKLLAISGDQRTVLRQCKTP